MKIGQYLTKLCVDNVEAYFFGPPCIQTFRVENGVGRHHVGAEIRDDVYGGTD